MIRNGKHWKLRLLAILMAVGMLISATPVATGADGAVRLYMNGQEVTAVEFDEGESVTVIAATGMSDVARLQWQIRAENDLWVDIYGQTEAPLTLTAAMVGNMLDGQNTVYVRCAALDDKLQEKAISAALLVHMCPELGSDDVMPAEEVVMTAPERKMAPVLGAGAASYYTVTIEYRYYNADASMSSLACQPYVATVKAGNPVHIHELNPTVPGYQPESESVEVELEAIDKNYKYTVYYHPDDVQYTVNYFVQNEYDDSYSLHTEGEVHIGKTASETPNADLITTFLTNYDEAGRGLAGLYALYNEPLTIAADGSTELNLYFDRNYYYVAFDLGEGGFDAPRALYVKYGAQVTINPPTRHGYVLKGWTSAQAFNFDNKTQVLSFTVIPQFSEFVANWDKSDTTYMVVFWKENPDDDGYSYWDSVQRHATSGTIVNGYDGMTGTEKEKYFIYNDVKTDKNVMVEGDGSTIVNVYYLRRVFELQFTSPSQYVNSGKYLPAHTHTDACYEYVCGLEAEEGHDHAKSGCTLTCGLSEHQHNSTCCTLTPHTHTNSCCSLEAHTHSEPACYTYTITYKTSQTGGSTTKDYTFTNTTSVTTPTRVGNTDIYYKRANSRYTYYYKIGNSYYQIVGSLTAQLNSITLDRKTLSCGKTAHTHGDGSCVYTCGKVEHAHNQGNCVCDTPAHTHTDDCYSCGIHVHDEDCPRRLICGKSENMPANCVYILRAKYEQSIADTWPESALIVDKLGIMTQHYEWERNSASELDVYRQMSKKYTMEADICSKAASGIAIMKENNQGTDNNIHVVYTFNEIKFGGKTLPEIDPSFSYGTVDKTFTGYTDWYDQVYTTNMSQTIPLKLSPKGIYGVTVRTSDSEYNTSDSSSSYYQTTKNGQTWQYFKYDRTTYKVELFNHDDIVSTEGTALASVMYGTPYWALSVNSGGKTVKLADYVPPYPSTLEPGYTFAGWYTSPMLLAGTEVDFEDGFMRSNLSLYAKWEPETYDVYFYYDSHLDKLITKDDCDIIKEEGDPDIAFDGKYPIIVQHGDDLSDKMPIKVRQHDGEKQYLAGWFYFDKNGDKCAYYPTMPITEEMVTDNAAGRGELKVFAEWQSEQIVEYEIQYRLRDEDGKIGDEIAKRKSGSSLAGKSKVFFAKGDVEFFPEYQERWLFPDVYSHTLDMHPVDEGEKNEYTFVYNAVTYKVPYVIRYIASDTYELLAPEVLEYVDTTLEGVRPSNVVSAYAELFDGYVPNVFEIERTLVATGDAAQDRLINVIEFLYTPTEETDVAVFDVAYQYERLEGGYENGTTMSYSTDADVALGSTVDGFLTTGQMKGFGEQPVRVIIETQDGKVTLTKMDDVKSYKIPKTGARLIFQYDRLMYHYKINHRRNDDPTQPVTANPADSLVEGDAKYESVITASPLPVTMTKGYTSVTDASRQLTMIADRETTFYYLPGTAEINYVRVSIDYDTMEYTTIASTDAEFDGGVVSYSSQKVDIPTGNLIGTTNKPSSEAIVEEGYHFAGWYTIDAGEGGALDYDTMTLLTADEEFKPDPTDDGYFENATYYALFMPDNVNVTIGRDDADADDTFIYHIVSTKLLDPDADPIDLYVTVKGGGTVDITDMPIGIYTITEQDKWSWRYPGNEEEQKISPDNKEFIYDGEKTNAKWLSDSKSIDNRFTGIA